LLGRGGSSARYGLRSSLRPVAPFHRPGSQSRRTGEQVAKLTREIFLVPLWRAEQNDPFVPEGDLGNLFDGDQQEWRQQAGPYGEHVRTIDARAKMHLLDDAHSSARRVDAEAFAAAKAVVEVKGRSPEEPDFAVHLALLSPRGSSVLLSQE
jgi:hypothetical protein